MSLDKATTDIEIRPFRSSILHAYIYIDERDGVKQFIN